MSKVTVRQLCELFAQIAEEKITGEAIQELIERASKIAVKEVKDFLDKNPSIEKVIFVCFDDKTYDVYKNIL